MAISVVLFILVELLDCCCRDDWQLGHRVIFYSEDGINEGITSIFSLNPKKLRGSSHEEYPTAGHES